jgi:predicted nucleic acid-binding Zn finger protein
LTGVPETVESKEQLASRFVRYSKDPKMFEKAVEVAFNGCVKRHTFLPSGKYIYTVVGSNADEFIDPDKPFCSCESFFYTVLSAKAKYCYHILGYKIAEESGLVREVKFDDEEYDDFMGLLAYDVLRSREIGKARAEGTGRPGKPPAIRVPRLYRIPKSIPTDPK